MSPLGFIVGRARSELFPLLSFVVAHIVQSALESCIRVLVAKPASDLVKIGTLPSLLVILQPEQPNPSMDD
jgi:hypothetical protein